MGCRFFRFRFSVGWIILFFWLGMLGGTLFKESKNFLKEEFHTLSLQTEWFRSQVLKQNSDQTYFVVGVYLEGATNPDQKATSLQEMEELRKSIQKIDSKARISWGMDRAFVFDEKNRPQMRLLKYYVDRYGDEVAMAYGFPNNNEDAASFARFADEWLYMYRYNAFTSKHRHGQTDREKVLQDIPPKYRPVSFLTYGINQEQAQWLSQNFGISRFMGFSASHYNLNQLSAGGSPLMPYWASRSNAMIPAQNEQDQSHTIFINPITIDPIGSKYTEGLSRWTIHPADPDFSPWEQIHIVQQYLNNPYASRNTINYLSILIEPNWVLRTPQLKSHWEVLVQHFPLREKVKILGVKSFTDRWKARVGMDNRAIEFTLQFRGSGQQVALGSEGVEKKIYASEIDTQYLWTETKTESIILEKKDSSKTWKVVEFTDYSEEALALPYTRKGKEEGVSYVTGRNYKLAPQAPLRDIEKERIQERMQAIGFTERYEF